MAATAHPPDSMTDLAIPNLDSHGSRVALRVEDVYREHFGFVWRSLRHLGVAEADVEDAAQDVFVVVLANSGTTGGTCTDKGGRVDHDAPLP